MNQRNDNIQNDLEREVLQILKDSKLGVHLEKHTSLADIFQDEKLIKNLKRVNSRSWDYEDVEILTSLVMFWHYNCRDSFVKNRVAYIDFLLDNFNLGNFDLLLIKLELENREKEKLIKNFMVPHIEYWHQVDPYNLFNITEIFNIKDDISDVEKDLDDFYPYSESDNSVEHSWYQFEIGKNLYNKNQLDKAEEYIRNSKKLLTNQPQIDNYLGLIEFKRENFEAALKYFGEASAKDPDEPVYLANSGDALNNMKKFSDAISKYEQCLGLVSDEKKYKRYIAECYNSQGNSNYDEEKYAMAIDYYLKAIEYDEEYAIYHYNAGMAYRYNREYQKAATKFQDAADRDNNPAEKAKYLNYAGVSFHEGGLYKLAMDYYQKAIKLAPAFALYYRNLALAHQVQGNMKESVRNFLLAVKYDNNVSEKAYNYNSIGLLYSNKLKDKRALNYYKKAFSLDPSVAIFAQNIGYSYRYLKQYDKAIHYYQEAVKLEKDTYNRAKQLHQIAIINTLRKTYKDAFDNFEQAIAEYPDPLFYYDYGNALLETNDCPAARKQLETAVNLDPINTVYKNKLASLNC